MSIEAMTQPAAEVSTHVALACADPACKDPIKISQRSVSKFIGHHQATTACSPGADHWHIHCEPTSMLYLSHERSKAEKAGK